jgi:UDP-N-acetylglucosamine acyltransferase
MTTTSIHFSSIIDKTAIIGVGVEIGPFCVIGPDVQIGDGSRLLSNVTIAGHTTLGKRCVVYPNAVLGGVAQHSLWKGGSEARVVIGDDCTIRECVTVHRSTHGIDRPTRVGNRALLMAGSHIAHDCVLDDNVILVNGVGLAGHVTVGRNAIVAGLAGVAQRTRIGEYAFVAAGSLVTKDVLPFSMVKGDRARTIGANVVGLRRLGMDETKIKKVVKAVGIVVSGQTNEISKLLEGSDVQHELQSMLKFKGRSEKGICKALGTVGEPASNKL